MTKRDINAAFVAFMYFIILYTLLIVFVDNLILSFFGGVFIGFTSCTLYSFFRQ